MLWPFYFVLSFVIMILCYVLNPIVLLFCDEDGELHGFLHYFQTWDDSCNPRCAVMDMAPKIISYDWDKHYVEYEDTTPELEKVGRTRWFAKCINNNFTLKERIKRYLCRVYWLTRNCSYGFSFYLLGADIDTSKIKIPERVKMSHKDYSRREEWLCYTDENILTRKWSYSNSKKIFGKLYWNVWLGWKMSPSIHNTGLKRCMIAQRISFKIED